MERSDRKPAGPNCWLRSRRLRVLVLIGLLLLAGVPFRAAGASGDEDLDPRRGESEQAAPQTTGPILTDTAIPQALGTATLFMPWFLASVSGNFSPSWRRVRADSDYRSLLGQAQLYYGLFPRTEVYVVVPYLRNWVWNVDQPVPGGKRSADFGGLGDISLAGKYLLVDEKPYFPAVAGILHATFPTGHHRHFNPGNLGTDRLGEGAWRFTPGLNIFKYTPPVLLYANLWYSMTTGAPPAANRIYSPDQVIVNLAMEYPLPGTRLVILWELVSYFDAGRLIGPRSNQTPQAAVTMLPALEFIASKEWACTLGVSIDLVGKNTSAIIVPNFSIFYYF